MSIFSSNPAGIAFAIVLALSTLSAACGGGASADDHDAFTPTPPVTSTEDGSSPTTRATDTPTMAETATPAVDTPTQAGNGGGVTATPTPDNSIVVTCGDIRAPLDKEHRLTADCVPPDLVQLPGEMVSSGGQLMRAGAAEAFKELFGAAQKDGYTVLAASAYRSYQAQISAYQASVNAGGVAYADRVSAHPGHSEHQLGTTVDVTSASAGYSLEGFVGTPEAGWLAQNSWKYGFIVSYPDGKEPITGYAFEPWHIRWLGKSEAEKVRNSGLTLHEYLLR